MVPTSPPGCDHMTVMDVEVTCAMMSEGVDGTGERERERERKGLISTLNSVKLTQCQCQYHIST